jgi:hypothetical protein
MRRKKKYPQENQNPTDYCWQESRLDTSVSKGQGKLKEASDDSPDSK